MNRQLCWFRTDLRVRDNRALQAALKAGPVTGLYIATPAQWQRHHDAPVKLDFWRRSLQVLEAELHRLGISLLYLEVPDYAAVPEAVDRLMTDMQIRTLHCNREYPFNEVARDRKVASRCQQSGHELICHDDKLLSRNEEVLTLAGEPFRVFTPYARRVRKQLLIPPEEDTTTLARQYSHKQSKPRKRQLTLDELGWPQPEQHWASLWPAGEQKALEALDRFCDNLIPDYRDRRDFPALTGTSRLSPHLAAGTLSVRQCWRAAGRLHEGEGVETWRTELLWRDFYQYVMQHFPHVCRGRPWRADVGHVYWRHHEAEFDTWCQGRTGIPLVDAAMRQLLATGWMHNRLRMVTAMFLSKTLLIDWRWGERWFMQHLVDGEYAANNGGWQWSASTGTDAAPYFRIFNPVNQSRRFDPEGEFIRRYVPELSELDSKSIHEPGLFRPDNYPAPVVDLKQGRERALAAFRLSAS